MKNLILIILSLVIFKKKLLFNKLLKSPLMITILNVNQSFLIFCSLTLSLVSCKKDVTNTVDITQHDWKAKTITIDDQIYR